MAEETSKRALRTRAFFQMAGGPSMDFSAGAIEAMTLYWLFLLVPILLFLVWSISRGTSAIAGELERGSMDLILSRPVSRMAFLNAQVLTTFLGYGLFMLAIVSGNLISSQFNRLDEPARFWSVVRPTINLVALGMAIFGYSVFFSAVDSVRWRPMLLATTITLAQFIALALANQPDWEEWKWLNSVTAFAAFYPIESAVKGEMLARNVGILVGVFGVGTVAGYIAFLRRDFRPAGAETLPRIDFPPMRAFQANVAHRDRQGKRWRIPRI
jgi:ABC-2 type transport system permease protein